jgi:fatty acid amide hydrolase 2
MDALLTYSASQLARMIRTREVSSREVVDAHIAQIQEVNPVVNAVVQERFTSARQEAAVADELTRRTAREALPPLHGVPCTVKECFGLEGMPQSSGLVARKDVRAATDASVVGRIRRAGAIPLGVTNVSELCMWMETSNRVYGRTNNPYDPRCIVGGSSGGEGAIIAAGGSPFGIGSDIGGSIRMPAFFNGVFGHKPSGGMVPGSGQYPFPENEALRYLTTGPLARRAEDLPALLQLMAGPDGQDGGCVAMPLGDPGSIALADLVILDVQDNGTIEVSADLRAAQGRVADHLERQGARVKRVAIEGLDRSFEIWSAMLGSAGSTTFATLLGNGRPVRAGAELLRWTLRRSSHTLPALGLAMLESIGHRLPGRAQSAIEAGHGLRRALTELIGPRGVMIYPSYSRPAPRHHMPLLRPFQFVYTAIFNVLEFPVTQVPLGLNDAGLPLGVQVAATHGNDHLALAVAMELERAFGGWVPPPLSRACARRVKAPRRR